MKAPDPLLQFLKKHSALHAEGYTLAVFFGQLGDFDSFEYAQALTKVVDQLKASKITLTVAAIGCSEGADRFCFYTGLPRHNLVVLTDNEIHRCCGLYEGLNVGFGPWPDLFLMCAGIGSPGTLKEVIRGYVGDRTADQRLENPMFAFAGGDGFLRPFELASVRLLNMIEVLSHWKIYVSDERWLCQRGATFICSGNGDLIYKHYDVGILGFSETMNRPLQFLEPFLKN